MTPEGRVKEWVKKALKELGAYYHMPVQNGMGEPTLDFVGCIEGYFFGIETKAPGGKPTPRQGVTMDHMRAAGAEVFVVSDAESLEYMKATLGFIRNNPTEEQRVAHDALHGVSHEPDQLRPARKPRKNPRG